MPTITIQSQNVDQSLSAGIGETILDVFRENGISLYAPCGGKGTCGKCRIHAEGALSPS